MNPSISIENQLLATKFFVPVAPGSLISRPRLTTLLDQSLESPLTLISAPAGFGKTTLLTAWTHSLPVNNPRLAWISLNEEDNEPRLFWTYVLTALNKQEPKRFTPLLAQLQSPQAPPLKYLLATLINLLVESPDHFLLILDDYQMITEQQVHSTLSYLIEHLPTQLHIILSSRADPPLSLPKMRVRGQILEVRTNQLRCTVKETAAFFKEVMDIQLSDEAIQEVTTRTEGWLVGLQLLGLSLPEQANPTTLLAEASGNQRYILDYLTEEVLLRQPQEIQTFLLSTCILEQFTASLCDAVMQQTGSQQLLEQLEQANLFIVSLDSKRQWYRYHALFAEALCYQLQWRQGDLMPILHHRASLWYAQHDSPTQAILHACNAHQWQWAAELIERHPLLSLTWGASKRELALFGKWLEQLPVDLVHSRPRLCLACAQLLSGSAPLPMLQAWLDAAEATLTASLTCQTPEDFSPLMLTPHMRQEQLNLLGEEIAFRAYLQSLREHGDTALTLCEQALTLLSADNGMVRALVGLTENTVYYASSLNEAQTALECGLQAVSFAQATGEHALAMAITGTNALCMIGAGRLHEAYRLNLQALEQGKLAVGYALPGVGWLSLFQADILREWNQLDAARTLAEEAISQCEQSEVMSSLIFLFWGYAVLLRVCLSHRELDMARSALQQMESIGLSMNQFTYLHMSALFTTVDQIRLWLMDGELDRAMHWAEQLEETQQNVAPLVRERTEVVVARILLAKGQPAAALERLEPIQQRATKGKRWGHAIEIWLLQALAHQLLNQEMQALNALWEALHLAEPEGYIRRFLDEGAPMEALLYRLRKRERKRGPTPYLDTVIAAFQQENMAHVQAGEPTKPQPLPEPLSRREREVLQLMAQGVSNQEIAQELVIAIDTVKRHVRQILSKLGVENRFQAAKQAQELSLLDKDVE